MKTTQTCLGPARLLYVSISPKGALEMAQRGLVAVPGEVASKMEQDGFMRDPVDPLGFFFGPEAGKDPNFYAFPDDLGPYLE